MLGKTERPGLSGLSSSIDAVQQVFPFLHIDYGLNAAFLDSSEQGCVITLCLIRICLGEQGKRLCI
jgi:hypothetical protein